MIDAATRQALEEILADRVEFDAPLSRHTSLRIGGPADALATPADRDELARVVALARTHGLPTHVLGAGFNVLVREGGLRGIVLRLKKLRRIEREGERALWIEAGASHATITRHCTLEGLTGLEFGAGIPGSLGGWITMNAGIGVREMKDVVLRIEVLAPGGERVDTFERNRLDFRYRALRGLEAGSVIVAATLAVEPSDRETVQQEVDRLLAHRQASQPLDIPSCGSVFRNPPDDFAGRLIEEAGLKGAREGDAEISTLHANFIVNHGRATARDVLALIERARESVLQKSGVGLETEVKVLGEPGGHAP